MEQGKGARKTIAQGKTRREETLDWWLPLIPLLLTIGIVYFTFFQAARHLFRKHPFVLLAVLIFIAPFGIVLAQVSTPLNLVWVLALTPLYGVFILLLVATTWMIRFYCIAYAILILAKFLFQNRTFARRKTDVESYEPFWQKHLKTLSIKKSTQIVISYKRILNTFSVYAGKYWTLVVAVALVLVVASTLVSANVPRNPTYAQALQFVASDKTESHMYLAGVYLCGNFSADFQENALKAGFNCGYVTLFFVDDTKHALNSFSTTDRGVIFIEPQTDEIVSVNVGEIYRGSAWNLQVHNATVAGFSVAWQP